jgi:hypothetical protein
MVAGGMLEGPRMVVAARALGNYGGIFGVDAYPGFEGDPADAAGVLYTIASKHDAVRKTTFGSSDSARTR